MYVKESFLSIGRYPIGHAALVHMLRLVYEDKLSIYIYVFKRWYHPNRNAYQALFSF